ncbi:MULTISPECIES: HAMP domain-containing sensor histidine kinase [Roseivirga]|uniref:histidine kinase n=1 Tax=Roseivirga thermotolerans TaxID=1758176 RepID=A0ABQ3ICC0_9BACT|nr:MULTISPECIES: HAMP domain-containing sensor histidine kinase [Roseivirga]GHE69135.1 hypothetical protein GCM10011340_26300 [Roseivirga thermotolerans]|tara:strand:+ start:3998 stop:4753 length:756 start_codon:yes stop_codon:yes gene_type:complete
MNAVQKNQSEETKHIEFGNNTSKVLTNMSAEFKSPLNAIEMTAQMMEEIMEHKSEDLLKLFSKYINRIVNESKKAAGLVEDTLLLMELSNAEPKVDITSYGSDDIFKELTISFENYYPFKKFDFVGIQQHVEVRIDNESFMKGLKRLVSLALEFKGSEMPKLGINPNEHEVELTFEVPGLKIAEQDLENIFEPFSKLSEEYLIEGLPLRLGLVKRLLANSQAQLTASIHEDGHAVFHVTMTRANTSLKVVS